MFYDPENYSWKGKEKKTNLAWNEPLYNVNRFTSVMNVDFYFFHNLNVNPLPW